PSQTAASASQPSAWASDGAAGSGASAGGTEAAAASPPCDDSAEIRSDSDHGIAGPHGTASLTITTSQIAACHASASLPARVLTSAISASNVPCAIIIASVARAACAS